MNQTERLYRIDSLLQELRVVPMQRLLDELGVSIATVKRDLEYMRERLNAPIQWDREARGYRFTLPETRRPYQLPGLWFSPEEAQALLTLQAAIQSMDPALLGPHVEPLKARLRALLGAGERSPDEVERRIRVVSPGIRRPDPRIFQTVASAVLSRKQLRIRYYKRNRGLAVERDISPQRLVLYRDNWHVDSWCHSKEALRSFALDATESAVILDRPARNVPDHALDGVLKSGYGLHAGKKTEWAALRFTAERARWVGAEVWHPKQRITTAADGTLLLEVPFNHEREILMDILKHGSAVAVERPLSLRNAVLRELAAMGRRYVAPGPDSSPASAPDPGGNASA